MNTASRAFAGGSKSRAALHHRLLSAGTIVVAVWLASGVPRARCSRAEESPGTWQSESPAPQAALEQRLGHQIPLALSFVDESGRQSTLKEYFGRRPVILALVYYECPMLCNQVLRGLTSASRSLPFRAGKDYEVVIVSISPDERPELALAKKRAYLGESPEELQGWHYLTGQPPAIDELADSVGFRYQFDAASRRYAHASGIMVATPDGRLSNYFYGIDYPPRDLRLAIVESGQGRVGSAVDQILLLCFHYDPTRGRYGLAIFRVLRTLGVLTVAAIVGFAGWSFYRERRVRDQVASLARQAIHREGTTDG